MSKVKKFQKNKLNSSFNSFKKRKKISILLMKKNDDSLSIYLLSFIIFKL